MSETTTKPTCNIRYVYVEMILNKESKNQVISGLFKGLFKDKDEVYVLIEGDEKATAVLNTGFYNVMTVEVLEDEYKNMTYLTAEEEDQKIAMQLLEELNTELLEHNFGMKNDTDIIDVSKYVDVPDEYKESTGSKKTYKTESSTNNSSSTTGVGSFARTNRGFGSTRSRTSSYTSTVSKDPEPSTFTRSNSKKPTKTMLELMKEKLHEINLGTFVANIPETIEDVEDEADDKDDTGSEEHDFRGAHFPGYGGIC